MGKQRLVSGHATFGFGVFFELLLQGIQRERTQLLHADERCVLVGC